MKKSCELYKYDRCFYAVKQEDIPYFANEFLEAELDEDHVCWLNIMTLAIQRPSNNFVKNCTLKN